MWKHDHTNYQDEEKRLNDKIQRINNENADFLQKQMDEKHSKKRTKMNKEEFLMNKDILKEYTQKKSSTLSAAGQSISHGPFSQR